MGELAKIYKARFSATGLEKRNRVWKILCKKFFQRFIGKDDAILDLACGYGEFINNIKAAVKYAVDLNPDSPSHLNSDISFKATEATNLRHLDSSAVSAVFTSNFLEHLKTKNECDAVFAEVYRILKPNGLFIVMGPNIRYAYKEYWDFYDHFLPLSHLSLTEGLGLAGFVPELVIDRFLPYTMNNNAPTADWLIKAYLMVPLAWKVMGKQFLVVARKPKD